MTYTLTPYNSSILRDADQTTIPPDLNNIDYQAYLTWVAAGNTPSPVSPPPTSVPQSVSRRQFYQAAAQIGLITEVDALAVLATGVIPASLLTVVTSLPTANQFPAKMAIVGATVYLRSDPLVVSLGLAMGQTPAQVDALFTLADSL